MFPLKTRKIDSKYLKRYSIILATVWTCVVIAILTWNLKQNDEDNLENAYLYTKVGFEKDILYRRWATLHGGIYVPITEKTQPNPYLIEIPERDIQTPSGKKLTLMNPAYMTRQVYEIESEISKARSHLTSLNPIRHKNKPDAWEKKALEAFERGINEVVSIDSIDGREYYRFMRPLITEKGCLLCHEKDGYKLNDIRGGISVSYPMDSIINISESHNARQLRIYSLLCFFGICTIVIGYFRLKKLDIKRTQSELELESAYDDLEEKVKDRTAELSIAKKEWEDIFQSIGAPAQIIDMEHKIIYINNATLKYSGLKSEDFIGKKCYEIFHCSKNPIVNCPVESSILEKNTVSAEMFLESFNKYFIVSATPMYDKNGNIDRFVHITTDISALKNTEEKLKESEQNFKELLKSAPDAIVQVDANGSIVFLNEQTAKLFGYDTDVLIGKNIEILIPEGLRRTHKEHRNKYQKHPSTRPMGSEHELLAQRKDGSQFSVEVSLSFIQNGGDFRVTAIIRDITKRKNTQKKLQESEAYYSDLYNNATEMYVSVDAKTGLIKECNRKLTEMTGFTKEEIIGKPVLEMYHPDSLEEAKKAFNKFLETGVVRNIELQIKRKNDSKMYVLLNTNSFRDELGNIIKSRSSWLDITDLKMIEESLHESQELFRKALDLGVVGMGTTHPSTYYFLSANKKLCEMIGYTEEELLKMTWAQITFPKDKVDEDTSNMKKLLSGELNGYVMEKQYQHKDGHMIDTTLSVQGVAKKDGTIDYILILIDDITERKIAEEKLKIEQHHLTNILESMSDAFVSLDKNWCYTYMNEKAGKIFGRDTKEIIGKNIWTEFPEGVGQPFQLQYEEAMNKKTFIRMEEYYPPYDKWFENRINPTDNGIAIFFQDVTLRKKAVEELELTNFELKTLNKVISESSGKMDIKNLMTLALDEALNITGLEGGTVCSIDDNKLLKLIVEKNTSEATKYDLEINEIKIGECLCGNCTLDKKPLILNNRDEVLSYSSREALRNEKILFHAAYPIVSKDKSTGVLCVFSYSDIKPSERSLKLVETLTNQMALSIENASLYEKTNKQVENLESLVKERTANLELKNFDLKRMNKLFVGREIRMVELKKQIEELEEKNKKL